MIRSHTNATNRVSEIPDCVIARETAIAIAVKSLSQDELVVGLVDHTSAAALSGQTGRFFEHGYYFVRFIAAGDANMEPHSFVRAIVVNDQTGSTEEFFQM